MASEDSIKPLQGPRLVSSSDVIPDETARRRPSGLKGGDGGGTFDDMEARVAVLETHIDHMRQGITDVRTEMRDLRNDASRDFRIVFGAIIGTTLALAGLMAKGFHWF